MLADTLTVRERLTICQNSGEPNAAQSVATSVKARLGDHEGSLLEASAVMVMMLPRSLWITIAPELLVAGNLTGIEHGAGFEMRRQMHRAQAALQLGNRRRRCDKPVRCDFAFGKELIERLFLGDQVDAGRLRGGAHPVEYRFHIA